MTITRCMTNFRVKLVLTKRRGLVCADDRPMALGEPAVLLSLRSEIGVQEAVALCLQALPFHEHRPAGPRACRFFCFLPFTCHLLLLTCLQHLSKALTSQHRAAMAMIPPTKAANCQNSKKQIPLSFYSKRSSTCPYSLCGHAVLPTVQSLCHGSMHIRNIINPNTFQLRADTGILGWRWGACCVI